MKINVEIAPTSGDFGTHEPIKEIQAPPPPVVDSMPLRTSLAIGSGIKSMNLQLQPPQVSRKQIERWQQASETGSKILILAIETARSRGDREMETSLRKTLTKVRSTGIEFKNDPQYCDGQRWSYAYVDGTNQHAMFVCDAGKNGGFKGRVTMAIHERAHLAGYRENRVREIEAYAMQFFDFYPAPDASLTAVE